jgi:5-methylcytosine-specific restriction protein A
MKNTITEPMSDKAYDLAKDVYLGRLDSAAAIEILHANVGMNPGSAADYIRNLRRMLNGQVYHRTLNYYATNLFLTKVQAEFGNKALRNALSALEQHLDYYDALGHGCQKELRKLLNEFKSILQLDPFHPEEIDSDEILIEGAKMRVLVNAFERNPKARQQCLEVYGYKCVICDFNFEAKYGKIGREFIHVHHLVELSTIGAPYEIDVFHDLRPVCPNCHAMLHKKKPAYTIEELREFINRRQ